MSTVSGAHTRPNIQQYNNAILVSSTILMIAGIVLSILAFGSTQILQQGWGWTGVALSICSSIAIVAGVKATNSLRKIILAGAIASSGISSSVHASTPVVYSKVVDIDWVRECIREYPEILWLADTNVRITQEGKASDSGNYSEQLFGQKFIEFDRTIMTIKCLKLILDGSDAAYEAFTSVQSKDSKLTRKAFCVLHLQGQTLLKSKYEGLSELQIAQAMETALVLGDIGKSGKARELFKPHGVTDPDHDDFHHNAMAIIEANPGLCPSFDRLPTPAKKLTTKAPKTHFGHITHLEGSPGMFSDLKKTDSFALSFALFIHTCDVAGALGHINNKSSLVYNQHAHQAMQAMGEAVRVLLNPEKTEWDAYNAYVHVRATWLGLNSEMRSDRVLARIGAMLRLFTIEEGNVLRSAMCLLDSAVRDQITAQLDVQQKDLQIRTPTYMPAVLVNLFNNDKLGASKDERLFKAITFGLPFIAKALEMHKKLLAAGDIDPNIPLNFNAMAGIAKQDPNLLSHDFYIDKEGNILLTAK